MIFKASERLEKVKPSQTLAITAKAAKLKSQGKDIIGLGAGEPDFDTPDHIKQSAIEAINSGETKYTSIDGTSSLKNAIIKKFQKDNGLGYNPNQILVSCGGKQSFFNLSLALLNQGDEVVIVAPYWVSYPDIVIIAGGIPVIVETSIEDSFKMTPNQLRSSITSRTKLVVINSPSNPSGTAYSRQELAELGEVLKEYPNILIATDDMYEHILWSEEPFSNIVMTTPELYDRTVVLNGVSKSYAMTGWRIGYCGGPEWLIKNMKKVQSQSTSSPCSISQVAATTALNSSQESVKKMLSSFKHRHDLVIKGLREMPDVKVIESDGTFYSFPDFTVVIKKLNLQNDQEFAGKLLEHGVALVPGSAFGLPGYMRISYATSEDQLNKALERIKKLLK